MGGEDLTGRKVQGTYEYKPFVGTVMHSFKTMDEEQSVLLHKVKFSSPRSVTWSSSLKTSALVDNNMLEVIA